MTADEDIPVVDNMLLQKLLRECAFSEEHPTTFVRGDVASVTSYHWY